MLGKAMETPAQSSPGAGEANGCRHSTDMLRPGINQGLQRPDCCDHHAVCCGASCRPVAERPEGSPRPQG